jgi:hypothetical protein
MITQETITLGIVKAALTGKIKGYRIILESMGENEYPVLQSKYNRVIEELEDILGIIEE